VRAFDEDRISTTVVIIYCQVFGCLAGSLIGTIFFSSAEAAAAVVLLVCVAIVVLVPAARFLLGEHKRRDAFEQQALSILGTSFAAPVIASRKASSMKVSGPPGGRIGSLLRLLLPPKVFERIAAQTIADMREECFEALQRRDKPLYVAALIRGHVAIFIAIILWLWCAFGRQLFEIWKAVT